MKIKRTISCILSFVMILGLIADFNPQYLLAATTEGINVTCNSLQIDGAPYVEGLNIKDNAEFLLDIVWTANNESGQLGDQITIDLPSCIKFNSISNYPAYDDAGNQVGVYSIKNVGGSDILVLDVTEPEAFKKSNLKGSFTLQGVLDSSKVDTVDGTTSKIQLFDKTFLVKIKPSDTEKSVSVHKSTTGSYDPDKGQQFTISLTSKGVNTGLSITDIFDTSALELNGDVTCVSTDGKSVSGTVTTNSNGFVYSFPSDFQTTNGVTYTLSYYLKVTKEGYKNHAGDWENNRAVLNTDTESNKTSDASFQINKKWIEKTGTLDGDTVNWTITVNKGDAVDIAGAEFTDTLPDDFTLDSDVTISGSDGSKYVIPKIMVSNGKINYVFPENSKATYTITYSTKVNIDKIGTDGSFNDITGSDTEKNTASIKITDYGEYSSSYGVHVPGIGDILSKSYDSFRYEAGNGYITWKSVIELPEDNDFSSLIYTDKVDEYWASHAFAEGTIRVKYIYGGNTTDVTDYTLSGVSSSGYTIDFKDSFKGKSGSIVITYDTVIDTTLVNLGSSVWPSNSATVNVNGSSQTKQATYTYTNYPAITKGYLEKNSNNTEFTWYFEINLDNAAVSNPVYVTEVLPENMVLDTSSIKAVYNLYDRNSFSTEGISIESVDDENHTVTIKVDTETVIKEYSWFGNKIGIIYNTKIDDYGEFLKAGKKSYTNEVVIKDKNGYEIGRSTKTIDEIEPVKTDYLSKNFKYDIYTAPNIEYEVNVNTEGVQLLDGVSKLEVEDQLGTALTYVPGSLVIYADEARIHPMDTSLYSYSYDTATRTIRIVIPDSTPCYISYKAKVLLPVGTTLEGDLASNKVKLSGSLDDTVSQSTTVDGVVLKGSALVTSELGSFKLYKHETGDENAPVSGATYTAVIKYAYNVSTNEAYEATYETIKNYLPENGGSYVADKQYVTGSDGTVGISDIYYDFLYEIKEVSAPTGYQLNPNPVYYYIKGDDNADYSSLAGLGIEAHEILSGDYIYINDSKIDLTKKKVYINKKISGTTNNLSGAVLKITYLDGGFEKDFASWTSTDEAKEFVIAKSTDTDKTGCLVAGVEYTLTETSAPKGYSVADAIKFTVSEDGKFTVTSGNGTLTDDDTVLNMSDDRALYFAKVDEDDTSKYVTGASLRVYNPITGTTVKEWTSSDGVMTIPVSSAEIAGKLCAGKSYVLKELSAPANYLAATDITFTVDENGLISTSSGIVSADKLTLSMTDKAKGTIEITKVINANASKVLSGVHFKLYEKSDTSFTTVIAEGDTGADGKCIFNNVPYGEYVIVETFVPTGYLAVTESTGVVVDAPLVYKQISNTKEPVKNADLTVTKKDSSTDAALFGATFTLVNAPGTDEYSATATTGSDGSVKFEKVPFGKYVLKETVAPTGYNSVPDSITVTPAAVKSTEDLATASVTIELNATTLIISGDDTPQASVEYKDSEVKGELTFTKKNDSGVVLSGAVFRLYDEGGSLVQEKTSSATGEVKFTDLKYGKYVLKEQTAPAYHEITFTEQVVDINSPGKSLGDITDKQYSFSIGKIAKDEAGSSSAAQIPGAVYEVYDSSNVLKLSFTTGSSPKIIKIGTGSGELVPGTYTLKETIAPAGYAKGADITFTVSDTGKVTTASSNSFASADGLLLTILENRTGKLRVLKLDAVAKSDGSGGYVVDAEGNPVHDPLDGVVFILKDKDGNVYSMPGHTDGKYTTDSNGLIEIDNLPYGDYILYEETPKPGYAIIQQSTAVSLDGSEKTVTLYNVNTTEATGKITINKTDEDTSAPLYGAMFALYDTDNRLIMTASSNSLGVVEMDNIPYGTYTLYETAAPENYIISEELKNGVEIKFGYMEDGVTKETVSGITATYNYTNKEKKGSLLVNKTDENSSKLSDAEFKLYTEDKSTLVDTKTTGADGKAVFDNLSFGTYVLVESKAPKYYSINDAYKETIVTISKEDTVSAGGETVYAATCDIVNDCKYVSFAKQSSLDNSVLSGAKLQILDSSDNVVAEWMSGASDFKLQLAQVTDKDTKKIAPGNYVFHEEYAPLGYFTADDIAFKVNEDGTITSSGVLSNDNTTLIMRDEPCGKIILTKADANDLNLYLKATFRLTKIDDASFTPVERTTSISDGTTMFIDLPYGRYILKEIAAPDGYEVITENILVEVNESTIKTVGTYGDNCVPVTVTNIQKNKVGFIKLTKNDSETPERKLADAEFELINSLGKTIATATTDSAGEIEFANVPYGTYTIKEIKAPKYYGIDEANTSIEVVVDDANAMDVGGKKYFYVTASDTLLRGKIEVTKKAALGEKLLEGAEFELYDSSDNLIETKSTDANGVCTFENLLYGKYKVKETKAPKYYILSSQTEEILLESDKEQVEFTNEIKQGSLTIKKQDINDDTKYLQGAVYSLLDEDNNTVATGTTGSDGTYTFKDIPYGKYYLKEVSAPLNYQVDPQKIDVIIDDDTVIVGTGTLISKVVDEPAVGTIKLVKKDSDTNAPLKGAIFELHDSDDNIINNTADSEGRWITDEEGIIKAENLPYGTYRFIEVKAPDYYNILTETETVLLNKESVEITVYNRNTRIFISKRAEGSSEELAGAQMVLYDSSSKVVKEWTTTDKPVTIGFGKGEGCVVPGELYRLHEETAPQGYALAEDIFFRVENDPNQLIKLLSNTGEFTDSTLIMYDEIKSTQIVISKKATGASAELSGATLAILDENGNEVVSWVTGATAKKLVAGNSLKSQLKYDTKYTLVEKNVPDGYLAAEPIDFKVTLQGITVLNNRGSVSEDKLELTMYDLPSQLGIKISKKAVNGTDELPGATLTLRSTDGQDITTWVSSKSAYEVNVGDTLACHIRYDVFYDLVEMNAPDGYGYSETIRFKVSKDTGRIEVVSTNGEVSSDGRTLTMRDELLKASNTIYISKKAVDGNTELSGATFVISDSLGQQIMKWNSNSAPKAIRTGNDAQSILKYNSEYTLTETIAPNGYKLASPVVFKISEQGKISIVSGTAELSEDLITLTVRDEPSTTVGILKDVKINVSKRALGQKGELSGASLKITDTNNKEVAFWVSGGTSKTISVGNESECVLKFNTEYILIETDAPNGYKIAAPVHFSVNEDGKLNLISKAGELDDDGRTLVMIDVPSTVVDTGDKAPLLAVGILLTISLIIMIALIIVNKKKSKEDEDDDEE